jgi:bacteriorhodopsin
MDSLILVKLTTYISILIQFITGIYAYIGIGYKLPPEHTILVEALKIELFVQIVEVLFYIGLVLRFNIQNMATVRYYDWFITTPTMLFTTILIYTYIANNGNNTKEILTIRNFIKKHINTLLWIILSNFLMLLFGYLGEIGTIPIETATVFGFIFLMITIQLIYTEFAIYLKDNFKLFIIFVIVWSLYGIVYLFPAIYKNITYNFLDIIAKNFFGIFLYYKIRQVAKEKMISS